MILTRSGHLYLYSLTQQICLFSCSVCQSVIFQWSTCSASDALMLINTEGQVLEVSVDEAIIADGYAQKHRLKDQNKSK